jgi:hypothetical protein
MLQNTFCITLLTVVTCAGSRRSTKCRFAGTQRWPALMSLHCELHGDRVTIAGAAVRYLDGECRVPDTAA